MSNNSIEMALDFLVVASSIKEAIKKHTKSYGIGVPEFLVMHGISSVGGMINQHDLSEIDYVTKPFAYALKKLEESAFIEQRHGEHDKRHRVLILTQKGKEAYQSILNDMQRTVSFAVEGSATEENRNITSVTARLLARNLKNTYC